MAHVRFTGSHFRVTNPDPNEHWTDCTLSVNDSYRYTVREIIALQPVELSPSAFTDSTGHRYEPSTEPPRSFGITCASPFRRAPFVMALH